MVEVRRKKVDEEWKQQAEREKIKMAHDIEEPETAGNSQPNITHIISMLAAQVLVQLGDVENPMTRQRGIDIEAAKFHMDLLRILYEKTRGNLAEEEDKYFTQILIDLRNRFLARLNGMNRQ